MCFLLYMSLSYPHYVLDTCMRHSVLLSQTRIAVYPDYLKGLL